MRESEPGPPVARWNEESPEEGFSYVMPVEEAMRSDTLLPSYPRKDTFA